MFRGYFIESPGNYYKKLIAVFRKRDTANILNEYPIITEFRFWLIVFVGCCLFDLDAIQL